ncbi:MAG: HAMP domain-containing protein [Aquificae bacterium]|nr:HAMP domain-containing protein [Aquificota bacterium]
MDSKRSVLNIVTLIVLGGSVIGSIFVGILVYILLSSNGVEGALTKALISAVVIQIAFLIPIFLVRMLVDRMVVERIREVSKALEEISTGNLDYELKVEGDDEIGELAESFERMRISMKTIMEKLEEGEL